MPRLFSHRAAYAPTAKAQQQHHTPHHQRDGRHLRQFAVFTAAVAFVHQLLRRQARQVHDRQEDGNAEAEYEQTKHTAVAFDRGPAARAARAAPCGIDAAACMALDAAQWTL